MRILCVTLLGLVSLGGAVWAQEKAALTITRFEAAPVIDGRLTEAVWQNAARLSGFRQTQPGDNLTPTHTTEVLLGYDAQQLYVAVRANDEPDKVRATLARRDAVTSDDYVAFYLDTFHDRRKAYVLFFNPFGVQQDGLFVEGQETDFSVELVLESRGVLTEDGWTLEAAIPFRSLRYEAGAQKVWGLHVLRYIKHLDEENSWQPLRRELNETASLAQTQARMRTNFLAQAGQLTGFDSIASERTLEFIPTLTMSETGRRVRAISLPDANRLVNQPVQFEPGLTAKLTLNAGMTLALALNPDFGEVEADQPQITANQRFPLYFAERRPFFLEGIDIFRTPIQAVHTRAIIDPDVAVKLAGKRGRDTFGLLVASDKAPGNYGEDERNDPLLRPNIERFLNRNASIGLLRWKRDVGKQSSLGVIATSYNFVGRHNQLVGVDGVISFDPQTTLTFQLLGTHSKRRFYNADEDREQYRVGNGIGYFAQLQRSTRRVNVTLTGQGLTQDYRAEAGFLTQPNINRGNLFVRYNAEPKTQARLISWSAFYGVQAQSDWQGRMRYAWQYPRLFLNFKRQTYVTLSSYTDYLRLTEDEFGPRRSATRTGAFFGALERSTIYKGAQFEAGTAPSKKLSATFLVDRSWNTFDYDFGAGPRFPRVSPAALADPNAPLDPGVGRTFDLLASLNLQPTDGLRLTFNYTKSKLIRTDTQRTAFDQNLYSLRMLHQFTRFTFVRARVDYDTLQARVQAQWLLGWTPHPGTAFYAGYNDDLNYRGYSPFTTQFERGWQRNRRAFFIKLSYLIRSSL
jgi:hypothetical protein